MRKLGALVLALPIVAAIYAGSFLRRNTASRLTAGFAASAIVGLVIVASVPPAPSAASLVSGTPAPIAAELLDAVRTGHPLTTPFSVRFAGPMDAASVAAALRIQPDGAVSLRWDAAGTTLTVAPVDHWVPDTLYAITVDATARAVTGGRLASPLRAAVLTQRAGSAAIVPTGTVGTKARLDTAFRLTVDRAASVAAVRAAIRSAPAINGEVTLGDAPGEFLFAPYGPLAPATSYRVWLAGLADAQGVAFSAAPEARFTTVAAPTVVRFRPFANTKSADRSAAISVRFTASMARSSTAAAFHVTANGRAVTGSVSWAEQGTVLVFDPADDLPYGATVVATVDGNAVSKAGVALARSQTGTFKVEPKPKPTPAAKPATQSGSSKPIGHSGGGGAVSGSWTGVESYYLKLMNCTRTGGWVTSSGNCSSPGGRDVAPLFISSAISSEVSRPYAKLLATRGLCDHFIGGNPGDRLRRAGYTSYRWAENLGCRSGNAYNAVLGSHLYFQSEKPYNGGHYRNLMNADYDRVGLGVWVSGGRVRLVVDFYHP